MAVKKKVIHIGEIELKQVSLHNFKWDKKSSTEDGMFGKTTFQITIIDGPRSQLDLLREISLHGLVTLKMNAQREMFEFEPEAEVKRERLHRIIVIDDKHVWEDNGVLASKEEVSEYLQRNMHQTHESEERHTNRASG